MTTRTVEQKMTREMVVKAIDAAIEAAEAVIAELRASRKKWEAK